MKTKFETEMKFKKNKEIKKWKRENLMTNKNGCEEIPGLRL